MTQANFDVAALLQSIALFRAGDRLIPELFLASGVGTVSDGEVIEAVRRELELQPALISDWQFWSYDKRSSPSPYLDGIEVGHYDSGRRHVRQHASEADACADFVLAEVRWVIERRLVTAQRPFP